MKNFLSLFLFAALCLSSCEQFEKPGDEENAVRIAKEQNASGSIKLTLEADFSVQSDSEWFSVAPLSGAAGKTEFTITATEENHEFDVRKGSFYILAGAKVIEVTVSQERFDAFDFPQSIYFIPGEAGQVTINFGSNVDYTVGIPAEASWLTLGETKAFDQAFNPNRSIVLNYTANAENGERNATVTFKGGEAESAITISQDFNYTVDWDKDFFRRSLGVRFTADWCGWCPSLGQAVEATQEAMPDRLVAINYHPSDSDELLYCPDFDTFADQYNVAGYPTLNLDFRAKYMGGSEDIDPVVAELSAYVAETYTSYPAKVGMSLSSAVDNDNITARIRLCAKEAGEYQFNVFLLENGLLSDQHCYTGNDDLLENYVNNHIPRAIFTFNETVSLKANEVKMMTYAMKVPKNVSNIKACDVVAYVVRDAQEGPAEVAGNLRYITSSPSLVDNAVIGALGNTIDVKYEE